MTANSTIQLGQHVLSFEDLPKRGSIRWAVGSPDGRRSSTWSVWGDKKGDVYLSVRSLGGILKASFHRDRRCQVGFTSEYSETAKSRFGNQVRHWERWTLPDAEVVRAVQVVIPDHDLECFIAEEAPQMRWIPAPGPGNATVVSIFIAEPPTACNWNSHTESGNLLGIMSCPTRFTWVVHTAQELDDSILKMAEEGRRKAFAQLPRMDEIPPDASGLRMILWGNSGTPADVFFMELNACSAPINESVPESAGRTGDL